jgi:hypothetical protein
VRARNTILRELPIKHGFIQSICHLMIHPSASYKSGLVTLTGGRYWELTEVGQLAMNFPTRKERRAYQRALARLFPERYAAVAGLFKRWC